MKKITLKEKVQVLMKENNELLEKQQKLLQKINKLDSDLVKLSAVVITAALVYGCLILYTLLILQKG